MVEIFDFSMLETIPDADAEIVVPDEVLEGPQTEEEQGVANLILDAISNSANTIQMYNAIIANCTDEEIIDSLNEILVDENRIMGKLQSILQKVSPNAEEIMNGAIEDSGIDESFEGRTNLYGLTHTIVDILNDSNELSDCDINSIGESFRITVNGIRYEYVPRKLSKVEESLNIINESLNEGCNNQELINAVQSVYGYNKKEAKDYIKTLDDKSKEELLKGFKRNAKKSFLTDSLKENVYKEWKPNTSFKHIKSVLDTALARGKYINNERDEVFAALDKADKGGYTPEQRKFIKDKHREMWKKNRTVESFIIDESNNLDTALDDVTPVRDVHNERAIRDHKKSKELRKNAMKEISKNVKDVFELDESLIKEGYSEEDNNFYIDEIIDFFSKFGLYINEACAEEVFDIVLDWTGNK